ncbi:class I SAM-dependent methyltransferase [Rhodobacter sp. NTK016B]|uniref:class I SAM-dependent methyltransferase n=1 Tax=Rhodobacter sp. NTK016B TaxID=2759676 RepID=UPI001A8FBFD5|nr:class I SAM-dependent methyltransferase [Rhodobacter sp. NTK016B]MBN8290479.1 class I SAM-dependent methyltransferase [Rhodobacter sp. NTK016B]
MSIIDLFLTLERAGPGDAESLRWALDVAQTPADARVLDAGCGIGADTGTLIAAVPRGRVVALDAAEPFVDVVAGKYPRAEAVVGDMRAPPAGPYDLIWSAGAVYNLGVGAALAAWRAHLAPGGRVAFSDLRWTGTERPQAVVDYFASEGVTLSDTAALDGEIAQAGWRVIGARWVGRAGWAAYYEPLEAQLANERDNALVEAFKSEINCWKLHGDSFDYRLVVVEPQ